MSPSDLLPPGGDLAVLGVTVASDAVVVEVAATAPAANCPECGAPSARVHSRYRRTLADLAVGPRRLTLRVVARRFRCGDPACDRAVFCERLGVAAAHSRTTDRLAAVHRTLGLALGGEPGARVAAGMAAPASGDTLLRRVATAPDGPESDYRFVGVDDFALRRGQCYGTVVVDLERGRVGELLDGRDGAALGAWLRAHPGVEVVTRDRWAAYATAVQAGAPTALQVADRFHLVRNLREALEKLFESHAAALDAALRPADPPAEAPSPPAPVAPTDAPPSAGRARREGRFAEVHRLRREGVGVRRIARDLRMSVTTVRRYLRRATCPDWNPGAARPTRVDRYGGAVDEYVRSGGRDAAELYRRLRASGCPVGYDAVRRVLRRRMAAAGVVGARRNAARPAPPPRPSARRLSFDCVRRAGDRDADAAARVAAVRTVPEMAADLRLAGEFLAMTRRESARPLADWLAEAEGSAGAAVRAFAASLRTDEAAVAAGLTTAWSNGPVEGQVNRLKAVKRSMYGRAGLRLLRARVRSKP